MYRFVKPVFFAILLLFPVADMLMAYLYHVTGTRDVILIRYARDLGSVSVGGAGFLSQRLPYQMRLAVVTYGLLLVIYSFVTISSGAIPLSLVVSSAGTLIIPISLTLAGFAAIRTRQDLDLMLKILVGYGVATALFGLWDVGHTSFWTDTIGIGPYIYDVKGIPTGFQPDIFLPWNFSGFNDERRAAGLLAAPLAQGFFLAVTGVIAFPFLRGRSLLLAAAASILCFYGVQLSATRGAILALVIACTVYFLLPVNNRRTNALNWAIMVLLAIVFSQMFAERVRYTVNMEDGSTMGHVNALDRNIGSLFSVVLSGSGVGTAGAETASAGIDIEGGGEGALFSIAYQLGVPGALAMLWYLGALFKQIFAHRTVPGMIGDLARALAGMFIGVASSMVSSEHILTFSGMGAFWLAAGGYLGYVRRMPEPLIQSVEAEAVIA